MTFDTPAKALQAFREGSAATQEYSPLVLAEQALGEGDEKSLELLKSRLSVAEASILKITECRYREEDPMEFIQQALELTSQKETRDLALEGRAKMERGLQRFLEGDIEAADGDLTWAETRLRSVALASRDHDLSLLNKASFHLSTQAPLMALQVYGEISTTAGHASETLALSRMGAAAILAGVGQIFSAIRNSWNAIKHAHESSFPALVWQANTLFLGLASNHIHEDAEPLDVQVATPGAQSFAEDGQGPAVSIDDLNSIFEDCIDREDDFSGYERPDLRSLLSAAVVLDRVSGIPWLESGPKSIQDPLLASETAVAFEIEPGPWSIRMKELVKIT